MMVSPQGICYTDFKKAHSSMSSAQVIDRAAADYLVKLGGLEFLDRMIEVFSAHPPHLLEEATVALAAGRLEPVERAGHSLKSSAANIGAVAMREMAARVEKAAAAGQVDALPDLLAELARSHGEACRQIKVLRLEMAP